MVRIVDVDDDSMVVLVVLVVVKELGATAGLVGERTIEEIGAAVTGVAATAVVTSTSVVVVPPAAATTTAAVLGGWRRGCCRCRGLGRRGSDI
jgi:hypothetical protein